MDDATAIAGRADDAVPAPADGASAGTEAASSRGRRALLVLGLTAVVALPLFVALGALRTPRWSPLLDLAMTEMRVRDVGTQHTPLVGLLGRLSSDGEQGSHLGPLSFWLLAPTYRVLGSSAWGLLVGVVVLNVTAIATTLWIALRRGGTALAVGFAAAMAVLVHVYGTMVLTEPWNPYMPVLWWTLTLVALWAVACDDLPMLPVAVFAASFCLQTHISYAGLVAGFAVAALAMFGVRAVRLRGDRPALRRLMGWSAVALVLGLVLWLPPIIDQATGDPGNMSIVVGHFLDPEDEPIGVERGAELFAVHLDPWRFVSGEQAISGSMVPAGLFVLLWAAAAVATWRLVPRAATHRSALLRLHAVIAVGLVLGFVSSTRILGFVWFYLTLWAWSLTMLMSVAIVWAGVLVVGARDRVSRGGAPARAGRCSWRCSSGGPRGSPSTPGTPNRPKPSTRRSSPSSPMSRPTRSTPGACRAAGPTGVTSSRGPTASTWARPATDSSTSSSERATTPGPRRSTSRAYSTTASSTPTTPPARSTSRSGPTSSDGTRCRASSAWRGSTPAPTSSSPRTTRRAPPRSRGCGPRSRRPRASGRPAPFQLYFNDELPEDLLTVVQVINDTGQPAAVYLGPPTTGVTAAD